jgi:hypothetical protein
MVVGGLFKFFLKDLKYPPTAMGGITLSSGEVVEVSENNHPLPWVEFGFVQSPYD